MSANIMRDFVFMFREKPYISDISDIDETAETVVSGQRGRRKTEEVHTSGAK